MEIGPYDEKRYAQLEALGIGNLDKRLKYLKINEAAERECIDALQHMAMTITQFSYNKFCKVNSPMNWVNLIKAYVNQFKTKPGMLSPWSIPQALEALITDRESELLQEQINMITSLSYYTFNSSSINRGMSKYTGGGNLDENGQKVWTSYKKWFQNSTTRTDVPVYRQLTVPKPALSAWWRYATDMDNGVNSKGPVGIIKSSRYLSCSFHKGFVEGACFPEYKSTEGVLNFTIKKAQGINISAFSGYNSTNQANLLNDFAVLQLGMTQDQDVKGIVSYKQKHVHNVMEKSKTLNFEYRRRNKMREAYANMTKLLELSTHEGTVAVQAEFLLAPGSKLLVDRIIKKPALMGAANVPVLDVHLTYVSNQIKENGLPEMLAPTEQSMFLGPTKLYT